MQRTIEERLERIEDRFSNFVCVFGILSIVILVLAFIISGIATIEILDSYFKYNEPDIIILLEMFVIFFNSTIGICFICSKILKIKI